MPLHDQIDHWVKCPCFGTHTIADLQFRINTRENSSKASENTTYSKFGRLLNHLNLSR
jgi:hypothetical protein